MKLFLKHIARDIKSFPLQPILIVLTLVLAVSGAVTAFRAQEMFKEHVEKVSEADLELGDALITVGSSDTRVMFKENAEKVLGNSAKVIGDFRLTGFCDNTGGGVVSLSATDLVSADRYFEFSYIKYGKFTVQNLNESALVSKSFAKSADLDIGDSLKIKLLGKELSYRVEAIAENEGLLSKTDIIVSIDGIISKISEAVPAIGALGGKTTPYTRLMIKAEDGFSVDQITASLRQAPEFSGYRIESTANSSQKDFLAMAQQGAVWLIAAVIILLAAILTGTALKLLESKRRLQYAAFTAAGASRAQISLLRYTESLIYSFVGAIFGTLLAVPLTKAVGELFEWNEKALSVEASGFVFGLLFSPALILVCTSLHLKKQKELTLSENLITEEDERLSGEKLSTPSVALWSAAAVISLSAVFLTDTSKKFIPAIISLPLILKLTYTFVPLILRSLASFTARAASFGRSEKRLGKVILLSRSFENKHALRHVSRLAILLFTLLFCLNLCKTTLSGAANIMQDLISADIAAVGAGKSLSEDVKNDPNVASATRIGVFTGVELPYGYTLTALSAEESIHGFIRDDIDLDKLPDGKEVVLSTGIAKLCGVGVGDNITVKIKGNEYSLTVIDVLKINFAAVFIDADGIGLGMDTLCIKFSDTVKNNAELKNDFISRLEASGASVTEPKNLFGTSAATAKGFLSLSGYATSAATVLTVVGCLNTLASFYSSRKREFLILRLSGMTRGSLSLFLFAEFAVMLLLSILLSLPLQAIMYFLVNTALGSFGFSLGS